MDPWVGTAKRQKIVDHKTGADTAVKAKTVPKKEFGRELWESSASSYRSWMNERQLALKKIIFLFLPRRKGQGDDIERFRSQLHAYPDSSLRIIYEYYRDDLTLILENLDPLTVLGELNSRNVLNIEKYQTMEKDPTSFSRILLQDIQDLGREAVIGLWECLCALRRDHPHPNLLAVLGEISQRGEGLVEQILLDEHGHILTPELKEIQEKHKQHLTEILAEHKTPGTGEPLEQFLISERYVNLVVVSSNQFSSHPQNELIQSGAKHDEYLKETQTRLEHISPNRLFRWMHQTRCVPHPVMVSGVPGIGKTTLMQNFVYDWVTGKLYQRFAFVFTFRFRDLKRLGEVSLEDMILQQYPYLESQIGNILQDPERLLFMFDGLDESIHQMHFRSREFSNPKQRSDIRAIVVCLVGQSLLKGCSVLVTSRPNRLASVDIRVFQRIADIMGFLQEDRRIFFNNFFGNEELSEKAFHYVKENDMLYTFCYIPSFCWIVCTVLSVCFKAQPPNTDQLMESLPKSMTQLFVTFVSNVLANHSQNKDHDHTARDLLTSIGWMAEHGVMNNITVFNKHHLDSFSVRNDNYLFPYCVVESGKPPDVDFTFFHLTLQDFFAALAHFIDYNTDRLQKTLHAAESYNNGRAEIFLCFLCGLSDSSTRFLLESHIGELSAQAASHVTSWMQKIIQQRTDKRKLLYAFYYLHESRNAALVSQCIGSNLHLFFISLTLLDCSVLSSILQSCRELVDVNLMFCHIQNEGLRKLIPALHAMNKLRLDNNHLTDSSCPDLASGIRNNQTLRTLILSWNNLRGPHFRDLMEAVTTSRIEELHLDNNHLTDSSCPDLASGIRNNRTLRTLSLSWNNLEGPYFKDLMEAVTTSRIEELRLDNNHLTDNSCPDLASGIRNNRTLRTLSLSGNNLRGPHFRDLMEAVTTSWIEELQLWHIELTDELAPFLVILSESKTLKVLNLSENNLSDVSAGYMQDLIVMSQSLQIFRLCHIELTDEWAPFLVILSESKTLKVLNLSENNLSDVSAGYMLEMDSIVQNSQHLKQLY
ncbi:NACHT, LRR and PYD domains-containing protein 3-like [Pyxicephalus adspersus]|uniref:NACHT, LRR and PYD domains-containing protein 3-like n=1 Tax=Pyxicephalus adspersus TaxID=30357 RepID=UPI003B5A6939